jgi:hypothetical protein
MRSNFIDTREANSRILPRKNWNCFLWKLFIVWINFFYKFSLKQWCGSGGQKWPTKRVLNVLFWAESISFGFEVLYRGLGISKLQVFIKKYIYFQFFPNFLSSNPGSGFTWNAGSGSVSQLYMEHNYSYLPSIPHCGNLLCFFFKGTVAWDGFYLFDHA